MVTNAQDKLDEYLNELEEHYKHYFDVERNKEISGVSVNIFAQSSIEHFRQVLTKKIKIDQYYTKEYAIVNAIKGFGDKNEIEKFSKYLVSLIDKMLIPSLEIMSTIFNGVLVSTSGFSEEAINFAERFKFSKSFLLGLKGWCDIRFMLIDLKGQKLYSNKKGEEVLSAYKVKSFFGG